MYGIVTVNNQRAASREFGRVKGSAAYQADNRRRTATAGGSGVHTRKYSVCADYTLGDATLTANYLDNETPIRPTTFAWPVTRSPAWA